MPQIALAPVEYTEEEYLAFEDESPTKHEFLDGQVWAMAGAPEDHNVIAMNAGAALHGIVRGRGCRVFNSDQRIYVPRPRHFYTYPDGGVVCGKSAYHPKGASKMVLTNPVLLFEVLLPSTEKRDRGAKLLLYRQIPALFDVLLIDPKTRSVEHHHRGPRGWKKPVRKQRGAIQVLGESLDVAELFEGI